MKTKGKRQSTNIIDTRNSKSLKKRLESRNEKLMDDYENTPQGKAEKKERKKHIEKTSREWNSLKDNKLRDKTPISKQKPDVDDNLMFNINLEFVPPTEMIKGRSNDTKPTKFSKSKGKETDFFHMDSKDNLKGSRKGK